MSQNTGYGENIDEYEVLELLGKGGFAKVFKARSKRNHELVAIKMIDKKLIENAGLRNRVRQEVDIHSRLKHPFVVELYTFFQDAKYVYLVMELASNGELQRYMKDQMGGRPMSEAQAACILQQVVAGILYLHSHRIMHRDISLSNLLLSGNMNVKIADFGLAAQLKRNDEKHLTMCGTPNFISPEVASRASHGLQADVWALGALLYTLLVGTPPFDTCAVQATLTKVVMSDYYLPVHLSFEAKDLINKLLKKDPKERIPLQNISKHAFMLKYQMNLGGAAAGPVAQQNKNFQQAALKDIGNNIQPYMQTSSTGANYNYNNASCDSGILTFASSSNSTTGSSFKPLPNYGEQQAHQFNMQSSATNDSSDLYTQQKQNTPLDNFHYATQLATAAANMDWQTTNNEQLWHSQPTANYQPTQTPTPPMIAGIPTATPSSSAHHHQQDQNAFNTVNNQQKMVQKLSVPPLDTVRLQPTRFRNKNAIMSILNGGEVVVEFIKFRGKLNEDRITDICWISKDGQRIVIYEPDPGRGVAITDEPPELPQHDTNVGIFSYDNLPTKHWRKYLFAYRFVSLVKASTPKVTYFSEKAKFHLMESMMHFEAVFYDGSKVTQSPNEGLKVYDRHGRLLQPHEHATSTAIALLEHQAACLRHCQKICNAIELIQCEANNDDGNDGNTCFPIVIGRRPQRERLGRLGQAALMHNSNSYSNHKTDNVQTISAITVPGVATATELSNGMIHVKFIDGTLISLNAQTTTTGGQPFTYMQPNGIATHFQPDDDLPLAVREKLMQLPIIEEELKKSKITRNGNGASSGFASSENLMSSCSSIAAAAAAYISTPSSLKTARIYTSTPALAYATKSSSTEMTTTASPLARFDSCSDNFSNTNNTPMRYFR